MALRKTQPVHFTARSVVDTLDSTNGAPGAMASLQNLTLDPSTAGVFYCRPASVQLTNFPSSTTPTFVSVIKVIGDRVYGMVASSTYPGKDEPFVYNIKTNTFTAITGVLSTNLPTSQNTSGDWIPPTIDQIGSKIIITHQGFPGTGGMFFGVIDASVFAAPTWAATNTTTYPLPSVPVAVAQFNNRAWYLVNPVGSPAGAIASDVLGPTVCSNNYVVNFDDQIPCTAMAGLPMNNQSGGVIQSLMVFKGSQNVYQIQGDPALGTLSRNTLNINTGTLSPRSIAITPQGLMFLAPDGCRIINFTGNIGDVIGVLGDGVVVPFIGAQDQTRICAAANASVYRISVKPARASAWIEYWFHFSKMQWTGPHTCPALDIEIYNNTFIAAPVAVPATLQQTDYVQSLASVFIEYGAALTWTWQTSPFPDTQQMAENAMVETTIHMALPSNTGTVPVAQFYATDEFGTVLSALPLYFKGPIWGDGGRWGDGGLWGGKVSLTPRALSWLTPIVFRRLVIKTSGPSSTRFKVGDLYMRYQQLGYLQQ